MTLGVSLRTLADRSVYIYGFLRSLVCFRGLFLKAHAAVSIRE